MNLLPPILSLAFFVGAFAATEREVRPLGKGPQRLEVDLALLARAAPHLSDLRLRDAGGREVPFVLVPPPTKEPTWKAARPLALPATKEQSGLELDLGSPQRTSRLRLEGLPRPFLKRYRLEGSGDRLRWTELVKEGSLFDLPEEGLRLLELEFPRGEYRYLRLVWDDRSSARLPLPQAGAVRLEGDGSPEPLIEAIPFQARISEPGVSRYVLRLPGRGLGLRALHLELGGTGPLLRQALLSESRLQPGDDLVPRGLRKADLGLAELRRAERGGVPAVSFRVPIVSIEGSEVDLRIENGPNPPVELKAVKAEAPPQPWIYFDSPDGAPLTASYADPKRAAPRYDLEALRDQLALAATSSATWGEALRTPTLEQPGAEGFDPGPGGPGDPKAFRWLRPLANAPRGLCALALDAHVLATSAHFRDLRLLDPEQRQIPYLLERREEPLVLDLPLPPVSRQGRLSVYELRLPYPRLPGARLVLRSSGRLFHRLVKLEEAGLEAGHRELNQIRWEHADPESPAPALLVNLTRMEGDRLRLSVDEGDNQPLVLTQAQLLLPAWRLRFFHPGQPLRLGYGAELPAPSYDLALLADRLRAFPARELDLPAFSGAAPDRRVAMTKVFWVVLLGAGIVLLLLLGRLLKKPADAT